MTMEVPARTNTKTSFFIVNEFSRCSFIFNDLSSSADGTFNLKLDIRVSEVSWFGRRLILACLHISEYKANVPPATCSHIQIKWQSTLFIDILQGTCSIKIWNIRYINNSYLHHHRLPEEQWECTWWVGSKSMYIKQEIEPQWYLHLFLLEPCWTSH